MRLDPTEFQERVTDLTVQYEEAQRRHQQTQEVCARG